MLSDFGGLTGILTSVFALISSAWNYQAFDNFIASRLFKVQKLSEQINPDTDYNEESEHIKIGVFPNCKNWMLSWIPSCCDCINTRRSRKEIALHMAREQLAKEVNIIEMVK